MLFWLIVAWLGASWADDAEAFQAWAAGLAPTEELPTRATTYRFTPEIFHPVAAVAAERPGVVQVEEIGRTHDDRPIWAFHIAEPGVPVERKVLIFGGIHALEWISTEVATDTLLDLAHSPERGVRVTVIPLLNPDGRAKVEKDLLAGENLYRRGNAKNVDLNRDFAVHRTSTAIWKAIIPGYYGTSKAPLSQPETQALDTLADRERYHRAASLHAFGGFFYYPWSGRFERPPDRAEFITLGRAMQRAQGPHPYKTRQLSHWGFFFRALGSEIDHLYGMYGTRAFLVELTRSGLQLHRTREWRVYFRWYNPRRSDKHRAKGVRAMRTLVSHPALPSERESTSPRPVVSSPG